ncbi:MAG: hypothetical protein OXC02_08540 [Rhodobacteraceae bacterium]|nr:hypothetical protein [Paracoccaceae bacterium]
MDGYTLWVLVFVAIFGGILYLRYSTDSKIVERRQRKKEGKATSRQRKKDEKREKQFNQFYDDDLVWEEDRQYLLDKGLHITFASEFKYNYSEGLYFIFHDNTPLAAFNNKTMTFDMLEALNDVADFLNNDQHIHEMIITQFTALKDTDDHILVYNKGKESYKLLFGENNFEKAWDVYCAVKIVVEFINDYKNQIG